MSHPHPRRRNILKAYHIMWKQKFAYNKRNREFFLSFTIYTRCTY